MVSSMNNLIIVILTKVLLQCIYQYQKNTEILFTYKKAYFKFHLSPLISSPTAVFFLFCFDKE